MNVDSPWILILLCVLLVTGAGCASTSAPEDWLSPATDMQREAFGGWAAVRSGGAASANVVQGELIAATSDSLFVLSLRDSLHVVARPTVNELKLTGYDSNWGYLSIWTFLGTLSTASHGFFLILSAPVWIIGGSVATASQSRRPIYTNPPLDVLQQFARFPQGMPPGTVREALRTKPIE
jgi:hypothetical protein